MSRLTQPLRDEHQELLPHIEALRAVADSVGEVPVAVLQQKIDATYEFLTHHLMPHAQVEEAVLYPTVATVLGSPEATATMSRDHSEISRLTTELAFLRSQLAGAVITGAVEKALRRVLYGLYTLIRLHFAKEEEVYLPLLDARLPPDEAHRMLAAMARAAQEAQTRR